MCGFRLDQGQAGSPPKEGLPTNRELGGWPIFALRHSHGGCPILAFFARVGGDGTGTTLVRSTLTVVYAVAVPALRKVREGRGTRSWWVLQFGGRATRPK
jgi:hypothetical protein